MMGWVKKSLQSDPIRSMHTPSIFVWTILRPCLDLFFSSLITQFSSLITHHSLLITHHLKYPTHLVFVFTSHHSNISPVCGTHCRSTMSVTIVSLPASLNSFHFIFISFCHHCCVTLPTQTQTHVR